MGSKNNRSKMPDIPDYEALARTQAEEDRKTANELTAANRPNQFDPMGNSVTWSQDPTTGAWTQNQQWAPGVKQQFEGQIANANQAGQLQGGLIQQLLRQGTFSGPDMPTLEYGQEAADSAYRLMTDRLIPQQQRDVSSAENKLRMQGLQPGTQAYDTAMRNLLTSQGDVLASAADRAFLTGGQYGLDKYKAELVGQSQDWTQGMKEYTLPWEQAAQAGNMAADRYIPNMPGFGTATGYNPRDIVGPANATYNAKMGQYNSGQDKKGGLLSAGGNIMSMFA